MYTLPQEVDAAAGGMSVLPERYDSVAFSSAYLLDRTTFVIRTPSNVSRTGVMFRPFSKRVRGGEGMQTSSVNPFAKNARSRSA